MQAPGVIPGARPVGLSPEEEEKLIEEKDLKPDIHLQDEQGRTPLDFAFAARNWEGACMLIRHGALIGKDTQHAAAIARVESVMAMEQAPPPTPPVGLMGSAVRSVWESVNFVCPPAAAQFPSGRSWRLAPVLEALAEKVECGGKPLIPDAESRAAVNARSAATKHRHAAAPLLAALHTQRTGRTGAREESNNGGTVGSAVSTRGATAEASNATASATITGVTSNSSGCALAMEGCMVMDSAETVVAIVQAEEEQLAEALKVNTPTAASLLTLHDYDLVLATKEGRTHRLCSQAINPSVRVPAAWRETGSEGTCVVCMETSPAVSFSVLLPCAHTCCDDCWQGIMAARLDDGDVQRVCCPIPDCRLTLPLELTLQLLPEEKQERWLRLLAAHYVQCSPDACWCPAPGCGRSLHLSASVIAHHSPTHSQQQQQSTLQGTSIASHPIHAAADTPFGGAQQQREPFAQHSSSCQHPQHFSAEEVLAQRNRFKARGAGVACTCGAQFCFGCSDAVHSPCTCQQAEEWQEMVKKEAVDAKSDSTHFILRHTKPCPRCRSRVEKAGGCNHMTCACRHEWCWVCGEDWSLHSNATGGYYRCNRGTTAVAAAGSLEGSQIRRQPTNKQRLFQEYLPTYLHTSEGRLARLPALAGRLAWLLSHFCPNAYPNAPAFIQTWVDCVAECSEVLSWSHALRFNYAWAGATMTASNRYLERKIAALDNLMDQLLAAFERMPHAAQVPTVPPDAESLANDDTDGLGSSRQEPETLLSLLVRAAGWATGTSSSSSRGGSRSTRHAASFTTQHTRARSASTGIQEQQGEISAAGGTSTQQGGSTSTVGATPTPKCPILMSPPPRSTAGLQIQEQLLFAMHLLQEQNVNALLAAMREATFTMVCITQASHAGVFTLSPEEANTQLATDSSTHSKLTSAGHNFRRGLVKVIQHVGRLDLAAERHKAKIFLVIFYMVALRAFHVFMLWYSPAAAGRIGLPLRLGTPFVNIRYLLRSCIKLAGSMMKWVSILFVILIVAVAALLCYMFTHLSEQAFFDGFWASLHIVFLPFVLFFWFLQACDRQDRRPRPDVRNRWRESVQGVTRGSVWRSEPPDRFHNRINSGG